MSEVLSAPKYVAVILAAAIGGSALTGCAGKAAQTWEIGVVCPEGTNVQVGSLDTDLYAYGSNDGRVEIICANKSGVDAGVTSMELTKGQGSIINSNKEYTDTVEIKYEDQRDGYAPEISMDALIGSIVTDNVKIESVAVTD
jgi:hypothetical protein